MVNFQLDAHRLHVASDFVTQIHQRILWGYREVAAFVLDLVAKVVAVITSSSPLAFNAIDFVE